MGLTRWPPVIWFAFARMRADREMACDAMVLNRGGSTDQAAYGATILKLVSGLIPTRPAPGLVGISERKTNLKRRMWLSRAAMLLAIRAVCRA